MITDAHVHMFYLGYDRPVRTPDWILNVLHETGIQRVLAGGATPHGQGFEHYLQMNDTIAEGCASRAGLIPSACVHTSLGDAACDLLRHCHDELGMHFTGELFDRWCGYTWPDPAYDKLLELAVHLRMIPLIHCENDVARTIGERYPEGKFIIPHMATTHEDLGPRLEALAPLPNLYLCISGKDMVYRGAIAKAVEDLGAERVLFGTDWPASLDPYIAVECVQHARLSEEIKQVIFDGAFQQLLDWTNS
jgi:predicted TIM-barrel fold metal-dependent hydrolase